jgi:ribonuclease VapC
MIVDTSVIIAILREEPDALTFAQALERASTRRMSAATYVEAAIVTDSNGDAVLSRRFDELLRQASIAIEPLTQEQARIAREAYRDFGKGRHRAGLNLGDCFAYALAKTTGEHLLCKGNDFKKTDLDLAEI